LTRKGSEVQILYRPPQHRRSQRALARVPGTGAASSPRKVRGSAGSGRWDTYDDGSSKGGGTAYLARYRGPDGRERSKQFAKRSDAERFLCVAEVTKAEGSWVDPARGRMRLRDWLVRFQESERRALRPSTLARDEVYVRTQILPAFGDVALARIEHQAIQTWVNELAERLAPTTVHKCHQILRKTLAGAVRSRLLMRNPCDDVQLPRVHLDEMRFIGPAEVRLLAGTIDTRYHAFVLLGAYSGTGWVVRRSDAARPCRVFERWGRFATVPDRHFWDRCRSRVRVRPPSRSIRLCVTRYRAAARADLPQSVEELHS
jgi:integrase-like protein